MSLQPFIPGLSCRGPHIQIAAQMAYQVPSRVFARCQVHATCSVHSTVEFPRLLSAPLLRHSLGLGGYMAAALESIQTLSAIKAARQRLGSRQPPLPRMRRWGEFIDYKTSMPPQIRRVAIAKVNSMNLQGRSRQNSSPPTSHAVNGSNCRIQLRVETSRVEHIPRPPAGVLVLLVGVIELQRPRLSVL